MVKGDRVSERAESVKMPVFAYRALAAVELAEMKLEIKRTRTADQVLR